MEETAALYPVTLEVDYPERQSCWKTLLRLFLAIPVLIVAAILGGWSLSTFWRENYFTSPSPTYGFSIGAAASVVLVIWIAIVFRGYIPRWLFSFLVALMRFQTRVYGYFGLLTDTYPPFEGDYPIRFEVEYPEKLSRWKVLIWKAITSIPHFVVLMFLWIGAFFTLIIAWFAIVITGHFPKGLHGYAVGVARWTLRVQAYVLSLTDEYPPFSLSGDAGPAGRDTYVISSIIGGLLAFACVGIVVAVVVVMPGADRFSVSYAALKAGNGGMTIHVSQTEVSLLRATDPADGQFPLLTPRAGKRFVAFQLEVRNDRRWDLHIRDSDFRLKDGNGKHDPTLVVVGGSVAPVNIPDHSSATIYALFEIDEQAQPTEFHYWSPPTETRRVIWEFK